MLVAIHRLMTDRKIFFLPVNTGYVKDGLPTDRCIEFYAARSGHGLYCAIVGNVVIPNGYGTNSVCAQISESDEWYRLADAISLQGALPGIQLSSTWNDYEGIKNFVVRQEENALNGYKNALKHMSMQKILHVFENLRSGIDLAIRVGFKHIQIHAGHGYLFSLLIDNFFSEYSDLVLDSLNDIARAIKSENIESSLRFSLDAGNCQVDRNRSILIEKVLDLSFSCFDVSSGYYNFDKRLIYPSGEKVLRNRYVGTLDLAKRFSNKKIILSGKAHRFLRAELPENVHIGICRDLIANPNFLNDPSVGCVNRMKCHYYSRGESHLSCGLWKKE